MSPTLLITIIITTTLSLILLISFVLLRKFLSKPPPPSLSHGRNRSRQNSPSLSPSQALQRQLQQLFHLHDSGLDQSLIDSLPVFLYSEITANSHQDPFDCAVCLVEFSPSDKLRLLPSCRHAFHLSCIDTWLLSSSTCPLCRSALAIPTDNSKIEVDSECGFEDGDVECGEVAREERVLLPVRLGKFVNLETGNDTESDGGSMVGDARGDKGECSSGSLDNRRCFSMGSYQYVVSDVDLRVVFSGGCVRNEDKGISESFAGVGGLDGKRLSIGSRGESFSVSKIWQWPSKKRMLPAIVSFGSFRSGGLPWIREKPENVGDS